MRIIQVNTKDCSPLSQQEQQQSPCTRTTPSVSRNCSSKIWMMKHLNKSIKLAAINIQDPDSRNIEHLLLPECHSRRCSWTLSDPPPSCHASICNNIREYVYTSMHCHADNTSLNAELWFLCVFVIDTNHWAVKDTTKIESREQSTPWSQEFIWSLVNVTPNQMHCRSV